MGGITEWPSHTLAGMGKRISHRAYEEVCYLSILKRVIMVAHPTLGWMKQKKGMTFHDVHRKYPLSAGGEMGYRTHLALKTRMGSRFQFHQEERKEARVNLSTTRLMTRKKDKNRGLPSAKQPILFCRTGRIREKGKNRCLLLSKANLDERGGLP